MVIIKLLAVIILLLILIVKKVNMALSLLISSVALLLINGRGPVDIWHAVAATFKDPVTYEMTLTILFIGVMGYLMNQYKMLDRMVASLEKLVRSAKLTIMLAPSLVGLLLVTGGALMSCPIVDSLGERLGLPNDKRAVINMIFRHGLYFAYPMSTTLIFASQLGGFSVYQLIRLQFPITIFMYILAWFLFLRKVPDSRSPRLDGRQFVQTLGAFLVNSLPITSSIVVTLLGVPFYQSLPIGIIAAIVINQIDRRRNPGQAPAQNPLRLMAKGVNVNMVLIILGVLLFKNAISFIGEIDLYIKELVSGGVPLELVMLVTCLLITFPTGNINPSLAIIFPFILSVAAGNLNLVMLYSYILYCMGFLAYYVSPLHMCQVLSLDYFKTPMSALMKNYRVFIPAVTVFMAGWYFVLRGALV